jgi:hypothetical protein
MILSFSCSKRPTLLVAQTARLKRRTREFKKYNAHSMKAAVCLARKRSPP